MALNTKISFYISRKNKLTLSPVSSSIFPIFCYFPVESGEKSKTNRTTFDNKIDARFFDNYWSRREEESREPERSREKFPVQDISRWRDGTANSVVLDSFSIGPIRGSVAKHEQRRRLMQRVYKCVSFVSESFINGNRKSSRPMENKKMDEDVISGGTLRQFPSFFSILLFRSSISFPISFYNLLFSRFFVDASQISVLLRARGNRYRDTETDILAKLWSPNVWILFRRERERVYICAT